MSGKCRLKPETFFPAHWQHGIAKIKRPERLFVPASAIKPQLLLVRQRGSAGGAEADRQLNLNAEPENAASGHFQESGRNSLAVRGGSGFLAECLAADTCHT